MAYPTPVDADTKFGTVVANSTSWPITYCTNIAAGDLLILAVATDGAPAITPPADWPVASTGQAAAANAAKVMYFLKKATGTETGTFNIALSATEQGAWRMFRIPAAQWYGDDTSWWLSIAEQYAVSGTSANPQAGVLNPNYWDVEETLWISFIGVDTSRTISAYPSNQPDRRTADVSGGSTGATLGIAMAHAAVASFAPGTFTISTSDEWGSETLAIRGKVAGPQTLFGASSMALTFGKSVAGSKQTFGQLVRPFTFGATTAGKVITTLFGSLAMPIAFGATVNGRRKALGQLALPITFAKDTSGQRKTFGQLLSPILFSKDVRGSRKTFSQTVFPIGITIDTAGIKVTPSNTYYGATSLAVIFGKDVRGLRKVYGQIAFPLTFSKAVSGQRRTFGQIVFPIIFTKEAVGRKNLFGQLSMQTLFGKETAGRRRTFSQLAMPVIFSKAVAGRKKTYGQLSLPINTQIYVDGYGWLGAATVYGRVAMPITFGKQVSAKRKTFGQTNTPLIFGKALQGRRRTFSKTQLPLGFTFVVSSGSVGIHGALDLDLILTVTTKGTTEVVGIILNDALALALGEEDVLAVYVGSEKVW